MDPNLAARGPKGAGPVNQITNVDPTQAVSGPQQIPDVTISLGEDESLESVLQVLHNGKLSDLKASTIEKQKLNLPTQDLLKEIGTDCKGKEFTGRSISYKAAGSVHEKGGNAFRTMEFTITRTDQKTGQQVTFVVTKEQKTGDWDPATQKEATKKRTVTEGEEDQAKTIASLQEQIQDCRKSLKKNPHDQSQKSMLSGLTQQLQKAEEKMLCYLTPPPTPEQKVDFLGKHLAALTRNAGTDRSVKNIMEDTTLSATILDIKEESNNNAATLTLDRRVITNLGSRVSVGKLDQTAKMIASRTLTPPAGTALFASAYGIPADHLQKMKKNGQIKNIDQQTAKDLSIAYANDAQLSSARAEQVAGELEGMLEQMQISQQEMNEAVGMMKKKSGAALKAFQKLEAAKISGNEREIQSALQDLQTAREQMDQPDSKINLKSGKEITARDILRYSAKCSEFSHHRRVALDSMAAVKTIENRKWKVSGHSVKKSWLSEPFQKAKMKLSEDSDQKQAMVQIFHTASLSSEEKKRVKQAKSSINSLLKGAKTSMLPTRSNPIMSAAQLSEDYTAFGVAAQGVALSGQTLGSIHNIPNRIKEQKGLLQSAWGKIKGTPAHVERHVTDQVADCHKQVSKSLGQTTRLQRKQPPPTFDETIQSLEQTESTIDRLLSDTFGNVTQGLVNAESQTHLKEVANPTPEDKGVAVKKVTVATAKEVQERLTGTTSRLGHLKRGAEDVTREKFRLMQGQSSLNDEQRSALYEVEGAAVELQSAMLEYKMMTPLLLQEEEPFSAEGFDLLQGSATRLQQAMKDYEQAIAGIKDDVDQEIGEQLNTLILKANDLHPENIDFMSRPMEETGEFSVRPQAAANIDYSSIGGNDSLIEKVREQITSEAQGEFAPDAESITKTVTDQVLQPLKEEIAHAAKKHAKALEKHAVDAVENAVTIPDAKFEKGKDLEDLLKKVSNTEKAIRVYQALAQSVNRDAVLPLVKNRAYPKILIKDNLNSYSEDILQSSSLKEGDQQLIRQKLDSLAKHIADTAQASYDPDSVPPPAITIPAGVNGNLIDTDDIIKELAKKDPISPDHPLIRDGIAGAKDDLSNTVEGIAKAAITQFKKNVADAEHTASQYTGKEKKSIQDSVAKSLQSQNIPIPLSAIDDFVGQRVEQIITQQALNLDPKNEDDREALIAKAVESSASGIKKHLSGNSAVRGGWMSPHQDPTMATSKMLKALVEAHVLTRLEPHQLPIDKKLAIGHVSIDGIQEKFSLNQKAESAVTAVAKKTLELKNAVENTLKEAQRRVAELEAAANANPPPPPPPPPSSAPPPPQTLQPNPELNEKREGEADYTQNLLPTAARDVKQAEQQLEAFKKEIKLDALNTRLKSLKTLENSKKVTEKLSLLHAEAIKEAGKKELSPSQVGKLIQDLSSPEKGAEGEILISHEVAQELVLAVLTPPQTPVAAGGDDD